MPDAPRFVYVVTVTDADGHLNLLGAATDEAAARSWGESWRAEHAGEPHWRPDTLSVEAVPLVSAGEDY